MAGDSNYASVSLHLPFNGPASSKAFFDRAPVPKAITNTGGATILADQSKYNGTSLYLDGANDTLSTPSHADFNFGTGDFTIELWVYGTRTNQPHGFPRILANGAYLASGAWNLVLISSSGALWFDTYNGSVANGSAIGTLPENVWSHIAVTRQSGTLRTFLNGTLVTTKTDNQSLSGAYVTNIGSDTISFFKGYIDDLRITKGVARYTANFTPVECQIGGLDSVDQFYSKVSLLLNGDTTPLADQSPVVKTITKVGNVDVSLLNSKAGLGSLYFDGTGDYLTAPDSSEFDFGTGDFTLECWYYPLSVSGAAGFRGLISQRTNANVDHSFSLFVNQNNAGFGFAFTLDGSTNNEQYFGSALTVNTWYHVAVSRVGANLYFAVNGTVTAATGSASALFNSSQPVQIGRLGTYTGGDLHGYLDSVRVSKGVARYTANFTPPTASFEEYTVVAETLTLAIPTSFTIYETLTLSIPASFVVVDKFTLSIPAQFVNYETLVLSVPAQINVNLLLTLHVPTQFSLFELLQAQIPAQFIVGDAVYTSGGDSEINGSELNGSEINGEGSSGSYLVTRLHIPTQIRVGEFVQLQIATQFNVNPLTYQLSIPTYFLVGSYVQLQLPTSFTVVSFPRRISIPAAFINYEVFDISLPTQFSVSHPSLQLSIPTLFWKHETFTLGLPARFQVSPGFSSGTGGQGVGSVVHLPTTRSQEWSLQVKLAGVDVSSRLTGKISIDLEESSAAVAVFTLRLPDGMIDPYGWVKAQVEISYEDLVNGVSYLLYQGIVDTPAHDAARGLTEFTCTDNLQNIVRKMTHAQVSALLPSAKWSRHVFDETADSWDYLQNLQETYPYALHLDSSGQLVAYNYQSSAIMYEFTDSVIIDGSLSIGLSNGREIVNQVNVSLDSQYEQYRESIAKIRWEGEGVIPLGLGAAVVWPCSANMPVDAIQGAGATFLDDPLFKVQPGNTNRYGVNMLNPGTDLFVEEFQGLASKRFTQPITESKTFSVQNAASIAQIGLAEEDLSLGVDVVYNESLSEAFTRTRVESKWLCSAGVRLEQPRLTPTSYAPYDPMLPVTNGTQAGFITYPLLPIDYEIWDPDAIPNLEGRAYRLEDGVRRDGRPLYGETFYDFDDYVIDGTDAERSLASDVLVAQAIQRVLSTHRQNRVGFTTFMNTSLQRGQTLRVDTSKVKATGVVYQLQHTFDIDQGTALTNVTLALSSSKALGILDGNYDNLIFKLPTKFNVVDGSVNSVLPVDNSTINYNQVMFQHVNENPDDFIYGNQHWGGFFTSYTSVKYQEFVVEWPDLPETNTGNATVIDNGGIINVDVPNDEFYLIN